MATEKTMLNERNIKIILSNNYNIKEIINIVKIDIGTSNIFKVETKHGKYILKEFNSNKSINLIKKEVDLINFLSNKNISVPKYIKTIHSNYYFTFKGKIIILQKFIEGYTIIDNTANFNELINVANTYGRLIIALKDYQELSDENIIEKWFSKNTLLKGKEKIKKELLNIRENNIYKDQYLKDLNIKLNIIDKLLIDFDFNIISKLTIMNTHGDYNVQQLIFNNKEITILDFERAKKMPIIWEIMRSYSYTDSNAKNGLMDINNLIAYIKEISKFILLNEFDLKYSAYIYLIQLVSSTYGYKEYNQDYNQIKLLNFGFFRTKLCKNLYKNLNTIGDSLIENIL